MAPVDDKQAGRPPPDKVLDDIAEYVSTYKIDSQEAWDTARLTLMDTIGCKYQLSGSD
jgi:2-methylcitrate dehydratase